MYSARTSATTMLAAVAAALLVCVATVPGRVAAGETTLCPDTEDHAECNGVDGCVFIVTECDLETVNGQTSSFDATTCQGMYVPESISGDATTYETCEEYIEAGDEFAASLEEQISDDATGGCTYNTYCDGNLYITSIGDHTIADDAVAHTAPLLALASALLAAAALV